MQQLAFNATCSGSRTLDIPIPVDTQAITHNDYGNICGCCGAYVVPSEKEMLGGGVLKLVGGDEYSPRRNRMMIGLNVAREQLKDTDKVKYVHIQLDAENVLTIKETHG